MSHSMPLPMVIVHRGGEANAPENTLAAFTHTATAAAESAVAADRGGLEPLEWWAETDLRMTADGELVLLHDGLVVRAPCARPAPFCSAEGWLRTARPTALAR